MQMPNAVLQLDTTRGPYCSVCEAPVDVADWVWDPARRCPTCHVHLGCAEGRRLEHNAPSMPPPPRRITCAYLPCSREAPLFDTGAWLDGKAVYCSSRCRMHDFTTRRPQDEAARAAGVDTPQ
jgi:hypothetical protein